MHRFIDYILRTHHAVNIICTGKTKDITKRFEKLKTEREEMYTDIEKVAILYDDLWSGTASKCRNNFINEIIESGGFHMMQGFHQYTIELEGRNIGKYCDHVRELLIK